MALPEANKLLKYIPKVVPTLNSYDNMCAHKCKNTISCLCTIRKNKDDETQYRGNSSDIHNIVGDQYHIDLIGMVPYQRWPTHRLESIALCDLFAIFISTQIFAIF